MRARLSASMATMRRLRANSRGLALIEFAFVLPILVTLLFGGYQLLDASACKRRVAITARAVADLVSQNDRLTAESVDTILAAASQIMAPYPVSASRTRVSQIAIDGNGNAKVDWSKGASPYAKNTAVPGWPAGMSARNSYYIYSEVTYTYVTLVPSVVGNMNFNQTLIMLPRKSVSVDLS